MKKKNFLEIALPLIIAFVYGVFSIIFKSNLFNLTSYIASAVIEFLIIGVVLYFIIKYLILRFFSPNRFRVGTENIPVANTSIYDDVKEEEGLSFRGKQKPVREEKPIEINQEDIDQKEKSEPVREDIKLQEEKAKLLKEEIENKIKVKKDQEDFEKEETNLKFGQYKKEDRQTLENKNELLVVNKDLVKDNRSLSIIKEKSVSKLQEDKRQTKINNKEKVVDKKEVVDKQKEIKKEEKKKDSFVKLSKFEDV
ncbi:MAG: hypothetical protein WCY27_02475 [archaeon]|jgi:hypothetical protein|nr:hypothetical protein [archaeon]MDD2478018.1 hypothetical protein [Candidatus ainarchaeum sp.]MDD3084787.1 hypothetical protein [Candidatus ainarchaeum sp.]MDD4221347.1 hypothetical protein [Candidatus ainarchaeum sp.]MDD4662642.1 hypothetical protein [Candidatus ainarchaeum sp.]